MDDVLHLFRDRLFDEWLPAFCRDSRRNLDVSGFTSTFAGLAERDAADFMRALDSGVVYDDGGGVPCCKKGAYEHIFNHGSRATTPRPVWLSLEPIVTIAALGRLHLDYRWPRKLLGLQPGKGEFDFAAFESGEAHGEYIAGEVKKTLKEAADLADRGTDTPEVET